MKTIKIGDDCFIGRCGGGLTVFGENGKITKITNNYVFCTTEGGVVVQYNLRKEKLCGKWRERGYFINFRKREYDSHTIKLRPMI